MKNKNGFVASSLMFSFFLVFILLAVLVLTSYTHYNLLIKNLNGSILDDLNNEIAKKYTPIRNYVKDGNNLNKWNHQNMTLVKDKVLDFFIFTPKKNQESFLNQTFDLPLNDPEQSKKIYVAFNYQQPNTSISCTNTTFSIELVDPNGNRYTSFDGKVYYYDANRVFKSINIQDLVCGRQVIYNIYGMIIDLPNIVNNGKDYTLEIKASNLNFSYIVGEGSTYIGFNNMLVSDATNISDNNTKLLRYLLVELPYIDYGRKYSLPKL